MRGPQASAGVPLAEIAREWGRIGCIGFGGPPAHVSLLQQLCVTRRRWLTEEQFERALAGTSLLPGPASTQLAIYCAWRLRGARGGLLGGLCFIAPGLALILALSAALLSASAPRWLLAAGAGAGAAVAAVAVRAGLAVAVPIYRRAAAAPRRARLLRASAYALAGALGAVLAGPWLVLVLITCGLLELATASGDAVGPGLAATLAAPWRLLSRPAHAAITALGLAAAGGDRDPGGTLALAWTALKVGGLAFGGGFVIVPLMQSDAVTTYHWMTHQQFVDAVALGQVTPGPVVQTVAAVGYSAAGLAGGLLAAAIAFAPSFAFILLGAGAFERLVANRRARAFLDGTAPAAAGAIIAAAVPLTAALSETWQYAVLGAAALALLVARQGVVVTLLGAAVAGTLAGALGAPIPR